MYAELPCNIKLALHFMNKKYSGLQLAPQGKQNKPGTSKPKEMSDKKKDCQCKVDKRNSLCDHAGIKQKHPETIMSK